MGRMELRALWRRTATWKRGLALAAGTVALAAAGFALRPTTAPQPAAAQAPAEAGGAQPIPVVDPKAAPPTPSDVAAFVNGIRITRSELARECLRLHGEKVLDSVANKTLIADYCARQGIAVTREQVDEEINRMAQRFGIPRDQWLKMLETERNITPHQYANDIIWPTIALRMVAGAQVQPTEAELAAAYETQFGPAVQCRLIACDKRSDAEQLRARVLERPDDFGDLAKKHSADVNSASAKGLIQPIRKHTGDPALEQAAFALQPGGISEIVQVGNQFVILKCESHLPARNVPLAQVQKLLEDAIRDKKLRMASADVFEAVKKQSQVDLVYLDPARRAQEPGVAARINGRVITTESLADECAARHGKEVLEAMIGRTLLDQALSAAKATVSEADIAAEIADVARRMGKTAKTADGSEQPDPQAWIKEVVEVQKIPYEQYVHDSIWPMAAMRKLVAPQVQVTDEDLQKGFEANYGPRVKCRAIVLNQMRKAQEVWQMARDNPTVEHFGMLAEQYSVDGVSRTLRGEVPPIQKHGGQPQLEHEAFALKPGEMSGIIQVNDCFVILYCEAYTKPRKVEFAEVRELIASDVYEKKLRAAMSKEYERLQSSARIDNFVAGTVQSPTMGKNVEQAAPGGKGDVVPAGFTAPVGR